MLVPTLYITKPVIVKFTHSFKRFHSKFCKFPALALSLHSMGNGDDEEGIPMRPLRIMNGDPERRANLIIQE